MKLVFPFLISQNNLLQFLKIIKIKIKAFNYLLEFLQKLLIRKEQHSIKKHLSFKKNELTNILRARRYLLIAYNPFLHE